MNKVTVVMLAVSLIAPLSIKAVGDAPHEESPYYTLWVNLPPEKEMLQRLADARLTELATWLKVVNNFSGKTRRACDILAALDNQFDMGCSCSCEGRLSESWPQAKSRMMRALLQDYPLVIETLQSGGFIEDISI